MTIKITECEGMDAGRGLLRDLAKYECELFISLINVEE